MASHGALCESCMLVPLDPRQLSQAKTRARGLFPMWPLGTAGRARASNCRFCQFVSAALYHYSRLRRIPPVAEDQEIELSWGKLSDIYDSFFLAAGTRNNRAPLSPWTEFRLCFVRDPDSVHADDPTTYLTPDTGQRVNFRRVHGWIESCQREHGRICNGGDTLTVGGREVSDGPNQISDKYPGLQILRLIDVHDNCIIATAENVKYVALSYLWGLAVNFRLTTANYQDLVDRPGSLARYWSSLPRTIQDALTFVRDIGERYLWCDALCLVQNNPQDVRSGLDVMDYIYERALFTIVGACGHDADAGLPGVLPGSRICSTGMGDEIVPGVILGLNIALELCLRSSAYISRGWTFQEEMLSRRLVYFVDNKVYFRCRSSIEFEHGAPRSDGQLVFREQQLFQTSAYIHILLDYPVRDFAEIVGLYSKRALTYQADALNAMRGIVRRVSDKMKCAFLEGIPTAAFDVFIIFRRSFGSQLRRRAAFPSYSWTGWMGALTIIQQDNRFNPPQWLNDWLTTETWIIWYTRSPDGSCALLWGPNAHHDFPWQDPNYVGYRARSAFFLPDNPNVFIPAYQTIPTAQFGQDNAFRPFTDAPIRGYPLLQFWTLSVFFQLKAIDTQHATAHVWDPVKNEVCGYLYLDGLGDTQFYEAASDWNASTGSPRCFEMILISSANVQTWWADAMSRGERMGERFQSGPAYTAMVLEWMGNVAERRGIGLLLQSAAVHSLAPGPVWKEILLG